MSKSIRNFVSLFVVIILAINIIACDDGDEVAPTAVPSQPLNEEVVEVAEDVLDKVEEAQSTLCNLCLLGGVPEDCIGVCK